MMGRPLETMVQAYLNNPCFGVQCGPVRSPWQRAIPRHEIANEAWNEVVPLTEVEGSKSELVQHLLFNIYEQNLLFLPNKKSGDVNLELFHKFYETGSISQGEALRPHLERIAFADLERTVNVTGNWKKKDLEKYVRQIITEHESSVSEVANYIGGCDNPEDALRYIFIQQAPDALSEASGMSRYVGGNYGPVQSELVKILVDEFGYGVHEAKHSTLFENFLLSIGVSADVHYYYSLYLPSSLLLANYFHYISVNKSLWFRYVGAIYYAEASLPHVNKQMNKLFAKIFPNSNRAYFTEHAEIDLHHRKMAFDKILIPSIDLFGESIIPEIIRGIEEFRLLLSVHGKILLKETTHFLNSTELPLFESSRLPNLGLKVS